MRRSIIKLRDGEDITDYFSKGGIITNEPVLEEKDKNHVSTRRGSDIFNHKKNLLNG